MRCSIRQTRARIDALSSITMILARSWFCWPSIAMLSPDPSEMAKKSDAILEERTYQGVSELVVLPIDPSFRSTDAKIAIGLALPITPSSTEGGTRLTHFGADRVQGAGYPSRRDVRRCCFSFH